MLRESRLDNFGNWEWVVILLFVFAGFVAVYGRQNHELDKGRSTCESPCVVDFPAGTQEDDFKIDYRGGKLYVTTRPKGHD